MHIFLVTHSSVRCIYIQPTLIEGEIINCPSSGDHCVSCTYLTLNKFCILMYK
ncbi:hypothetical protein PVAP13_6NG332570 [Panicum virgatum]|uniref:Uncharacterized protein n=1 Tax=Panicum virgatum TaxID=38727 RepID=A0A8T0R411_PANVG|nr:hypothetical protein PVAP13_6NG332570 [Panicum virgatum]